MTDRSKALRKLMTDYKLSADDVADMLDRSVQTVRIWRCANSGRPIPKSMLELLQLKCQQPDAAKK